MSARPDLMAKLEKIVDVDASLSAGHLIAKSDREPTEDERAGMAWWNGLSFDARAVWLARCGGTTAADAWAYYTLPNPPANPMVQHIREMHAAKVLDEQQASERRVLAEHFETPAEDIRNALTIMRLHEDGPLDAEVREDVEARIQAALEKIERLDELNHNPIRFVLRVANMERALVELRKQFDESTLGMSASGGGR